MRYGMPWDGFLRRGRAVEMFLFCFYSTEFVLVSSYGPEMKYIQEFHKENDANVAQKKVRQISFKKLG